MELSIIIPVYNVEDYLQDCLDSLSNLSYHNKELIIVNDGSTDNSEEVILAFIKKFPAAKYISKTNGGLSSARNAGFEKASGKYCLFIDSDDIVESKYIDNLLVFAASEKAQIVVFDYFEFTESNRKIRYDRSNFSEPLICEEDRLKKILNLDVSFAVWNKLYETSFLKEAKISFKYGVWYEDLDFVFHCFYRAKMIVKANYLIYGYRQRQGSIMNTLSLKTLDKISIAKELKKFLVAEGKFEKYQNDFQILFLKMSFSVIYSSFKNKNLNKKIAWDIAKTVMRDSDFIFFSKTPLINKSKLSITEKFLFYIFYYNFGRAILILFK